MSLWVSANYDEELVDKAVMLTTLSYAGQLNRYHLFEARNGQVTLATYDNQPNLVEYLRENTPCVFALHLCKQGQYEYNLTISGKPVHVRTIAKALVIYRGTEETPRILTPQNDVEIIIE